MESTVRWRTPLTLLPYILFSVEGNQYFYTTLPIEHLPESTNHRGKYHFTSDLTIICLDSAALLVWHEQQFYPVWSNRNQSNRRSAVQWYFPLLWVFTLHLLTAKQTKVANLTEWRWVDDVEDEDEDVGIGVRQVPESVERLLTGGVPEMQLWLKSIRFGSMHL